MKKFVTGALGIAALLALIGLGIVQAIRCRLMLLSFWTTPPRHTLHCHALKNGDLGRHNR
jgi:hypothetical protein